MTVSKWLDKIADYDREFGKWERRVQRIVDRYRDKRTETDTDARYNILWSNVQTLVSAVYSRVPKPEVTRRYRDKDEVARVATTILERCLEFELEQYADFRESLRYAVSDRFLGGRGTTWVRYEPELVTDPAQPDNDDGAQITEDVDDHEREVVEWEKCPVDYVHWKDFGHVVARTWEEVPALWRRVYMSKDAVIKRFGQEVADKLAYSARQDYEYTGSDNEPDKACIYEIWCKDSGKVYWLAKGVSEYLDERDDPLGLDEFFPCPRPLFATLTTDSLVPVPDYSLYQDQARELDTICQRIDGLVSALKVVGVYDGTQKQISRMFREAGNTQLIAVDQWSLFAEKGGIKGAIEFVPLDTISMALDRLYVARDQIQQQIYEITGLSDIIRGASQASETATAQQIKSQYASLRLKTLKDAVAVYATDILRIKAQIMCRHYQPHVMLAISAAEQMGEPDELIAQAIALLKQGPLMQFRIEVVADSLVMVDEQEQRQQRVEFLAAAGGFLKEAVTAYQTVPQLGPLLSEMLMFGVRGFNVGRSIEGKFHQAMEQLGQPQPDKPDPEAAKAQADMQMEQARMQADMQIEQQKMQLQMAMKQEQIASDERMARMKAEMQMQIEAAKAEAKPSTTVSIDGKEQIGEVAQALQALGADQAVRMEAVGAQMNESVAMLSETSQTIAQAAAAIAQAAQMLSAPRRVVRGPDGRVAGMEVAQ